MSWLATLYQRVYKVIQNTVSLYRHISSCHMRAVLGKPPPHHEPFPLPSKGTIYADKVGSNIELKKCFRNVVRAIRMRELMNPQELKMMTPFLV